MSPLESADGEGRGALAGGNEACQMLQQQVRPLETWIEERAQGADAVVMLGDFNRNLWHERNRPAEEAVRTDASDPATPLPEGVRVRNLLAEVVDAEPEETALMLMDEICDVSPEVGRLCERAKAALLSRDEARQVSSVEGLGCRNPIGLDHILISQGLTALPARKVPLGVFGRTRAASGSRPDPLLAVSDHCPLATTVRF